MVYSLVVIMLVVAFAYAGFKVSSDILKYGFWGVSCLTFLAFLFVGFGGYSGGKTVSYETIQTLENLELRHYDSKLLVTTRVESDAKSAMSHGFKSLADYIFGGNQAGETIAMTAPILQFDVIPDFEGQASHKLAFILPEDRSWESYPKPNDSKVGLEVWHAADYLVYPWRGDYSEAQVRVGLELIQKHCQGKNLQCSMPAIHAAYSPPWVFPWRRLHELWVRIDHD